MNYEDQIIEEIELHSPEGIENCFRHGVSPNMRFKDEPLIYELTSEYGRTSRFKDCVRVFVENGLEFEDKILMSVLLDDHLSLESFLSNDPGILKNRYTLRCAYTPLYEATLLHVCAEFNHLNCARVLVQLGADPNATAGVDEDGFGGQTPVFHTVNQNSNNSMAMLEYLLELQVDLHLTVPGLIWGKGYPWETLIPSVNPVSYAQMGLLPQMHRNEIVIAEVVSRLLKAAYNIDYTARNVPCAYLK